MSAEEFIWDVNIPYDEEINYNTLVTRYEDGKEQRRKKWSQPKRMFTVSLRGRTNTIINQVWNFYSSRTGAFDTFYFENLNESPITGENFGSGDGSTTVFNLDSFPLPSGGLTAVKYNGVTIGSGNYTVNRTTGAVTFTTAPSGGTTAITADYKFCRIVRFVEDKLTRELFNYKLYNSQFKLLEVL